MINLSNSAFLPAVFRSSPSPYRGAAAQAQASEDGGKSSYVFILLAINPWQPQCTNCAAACKRCDDSRPCERCQKYGLADSCVDGQRKERKKGIKRGPYKRKAKPANGEGTLSGRVHRTRTDVSD